MMESVIGAFLTSVAYAFVLQVPRDKIIAAAINGAAAWLLYRTLSSHCTLLFSVYAAGISMAAGAHLLARIRKTPVLVILIPSFIPFVPGGDIYKCIYYLLMDQTALSAHHLGNTIAISGMIALGNISVETFYQLLKRCRQLVMKEERNS